jgi:thiamine kinase-like enzyme
MEFIRQSTSIPLPKVIKIYKQDLDEEGEDVIMQYVGDETLSRAWPKMTDVSKRAIAKELAGYIEQMRQLTPPGAGFVGSASLSPGRDNCFGQARFGPFDNMADFHTYIRRKNPLEIWKEEPDVVQVHSTADSYGSKFTHGDLVPNNIIVKDGRIAAIIDWEFAGWFPEYWEYVKMRYQWRPYREEYFEVMDGAMVKYPLEFRAEEAIWKRIDDYVYEMPYRDS